MADIGKSHYREQKQKDQQEQQAPPSSTRSSLRADTKVIVGPNLDINVKNLPLREEEELSTKSKPNKIEASYSFHLDEPPRHPVDILIVESRDEESVHIIGSKEPESDRDIDVNIRHNKNSYHIMTSTVALETIESPKTENGIEHIDKREGESAPPTRGVRFSDDNQKQQNEHGDPQSNGKLAVDVKAVTSSSEEEETLTPASNTPSPKLPPIRKKHKGTTLATRPSVFERLSNTETVASLHQKFLPQQSRPKTTTERRMKRSTSAPPSLRAKNSRPKSTQIQKKKLKPQAVENKKTLYLTQKFAQLASSFERLSEKHTALSQSRRRARNDSNINSSNNNRNSTSRSKRSNSLGRRHSFSRGLNNHEGFNAPSRQVRGSQIRTSSKNNINNSNANRTRHQYRSKLAKDTLADAFEDESLGPPLEIEFCSKMKILCSSKFMPEEGFTELDIFELGLNPFLSEYEAGSISAKHFASEIMNALLWRDLPPEVKWDAQRPLERELAMPIGEIGYSFMIEATGKSIYQDSDQSDDEGKDDEDLLIYTASAAGHVTFLPDWEIQVENYSCVHDGY